MSGAIPKCSWCGEYRAYPGSEFCSICRPHKDPTFEPPPRALAPVTGRRTVLSTVGVWRKHTDAGAWLIYAPHRTLAYALEHGLRARVRRADGSEHLVTIEHVSDPDDDGYGWAHPAGTASSTQLVESLPARMRKETKPKVRRHGSTGRNQRRKARMS